MRRRWLDDGRKVADQFILHLFGGRNPTPRSSIFGEGRQDVSRMPVVATCLDVDEGDEKCGMKVLINNNIYVSSVWGVLEVNTHF